MSDSLVVHQGSDFARDFPVLDVQGRPRILSGWSAELLVRRLPTGEVVLRRPVRLTTGRATVSVPAGDSDGWAFPLGTFDVALHGPRGDRELLASGRVLVHRRAR